MIFVETKLPGAFIVDLETVEDERGFFSRTWCRQEFAAHGLASILAQCSISFNHKSGTLRGMHYQIAPFQEAKLVRCTAGAIYDVILDLRRNSSSFGDWLAVELTSRNHRMIYVPEGFAHGFQTLEKNTEVFYQISEIYAPQFARGIRWDDPKFRIEWPAADRTISRRDASYADFELDPASHDEL